jgi:hypothetical protein
MVVNPRTLEKSRQEPMVYGGVLLVGLLFDRKCLVFAVDCTFTKPDVFLTKRLMLFRKEFLTSIAK